MSTLVLLSGGLDSTALLAHYAQRGRPLTALTFLYGQAQAHAEAAAAAYQAAAWSASHHLVTLHLPRARPGHAYVPARNLALLASGLAWAEHLGAADLALGLTQDDHAAYPDCSPAFVAILAALCPHATRRPVRLKCPFLFQPRSDILQAAQRHGVSWSHTHSCQHSPALGQGCGRCPGCRDRREAFAQALLADPVTYPTA